MGFHASAVGGLGLYGAVVQVNCARCGRSTVQLASVRDLDSLQCPHCGNSRRRSGCVGSDGHHSGSRVERLNSGPTMTLYHQTSAENAQLIIASQQMRRGSDGLCGGGIYFADSPSATDAKARSKGVVLRASVRLGRSKQVDDGDHGISFQSLLSDGYDSVISRRNTGTEYVVYNHDQVSDIRRA